MATPILHHYDVSPYSEKIRLIFGLKKLAWQSVLTPWIMPKDDLTELTGGYRKAPVLQIGADIYCDSRLIPRVLDELEPSPPLFAGGSEATEFALGAMSDATFMAGVVLFLGAGDIFPPEFLEDRQKMFPGGFKVEEAQAAMPAKRGQIREVLGTWNQQLSDGRPYLLGDKISIADFSVHHVVWFLSAYPVSSTMLSPYISLVTWLERISAIGHGERSEISGSDAIEIARQAVPSQGLGVEAGDPNDWAVGDHMVVLAEDYAREPIEGELVTANLQEIAIRRHSEKAGDLVVHFPRQGFFAMKTG
jgi:glutathione S-transferase